MSTQIDQQTEKPQSGGPFSTSMFAPGMTGLTTTALLKLMEDLMIIANLYGKQFSQQIQAQSAVAQSLGQSQVDLGQSEMADYIGQAIASGIGGLASLGITASGSFGNEELTSTQKELNDAQAEQEKLKSMDPPVAGITEEETVETESSQELMTEPERQKQIDENNQKIETLNKKLESLKSEVQAKMQKRTTFGGALQNITSSGGNINSAIQKAKEGEQNKNVTLSQAAMQGMEQISSQSMQNSNKYLNQSESITEILKAISNSNRYIGS